MVTSYFFHLNHCISNAPGKPTVSPRFDKSTDFKIDYLQPAASSIGTGQIKDLLKTQHNCELKCGDRKPLVRHVWSSPHSERLTTSSTYVDERGNWRKQHRDLAAYSYLLIVCPLLILADNSSSATIPKRPPAMTEFIRRRS